MRTEDRYASELADLANRDPGVSAGLQRFEQIFDAYMIEASGSFVDKRKALLDAFRAQAPQGELAALFLDRLGAVP